LVYDRIILGYHGCDRTVAKKLLDGVPFAPSQNDYDWLGHGIYFWEFGPDRALRFAKDQKERKKLKTPSVVGALIQLGNCFDLLDTHFTHDLAQAYGEFERITKEQGLPLPKNRGNTPDKKLRKLDCAVLNWYLARAAHQGNEYDTVRGGFIEGGEVFPGSGISKETHIQVAVRNPTCILGVFRPGRTR
jgi:hypothetical protein